MKQPQWKKPTIKKEREPYRKSHLEKMLDRKLRGNLEPEPVDEFDAANEHHPFDLED